MTNFKVIGIGVNTESTRFDPKGVISTTTAELAGQTAGKLFVAITDDDPNKPNAFGLIFDGQQVEVMQNEKYMQTNTVSKPKKGYKTYAFEVPMRVISAAQKPSAHSIQFMLGTMVEEKFIPDGESAIFKLVVTSDDIVAGEITPE
jgi:hypothetical protein